MSRARKRSSSRPWSLRLCCWTSFLSIHLIVTPSWRRRILGVGLLLVQNGIHFLLSWYGLVLKYWFTLFIVNLDWGLLHLILKLLNVSWRLAMQDLIFLDLCHWHGLLHYLLLLLHNHVILHLLFLWLDHFLSLALLLDSLSLVLGIFKVFSLIEEILELLVDKLDLLMTKRIGLAVN